MLLPLAADNHQQAVAAAATPEHRLALVLSAVLAARPGDIRQLLLDDVDLGDRRITIGGQIRHLDDLACHVVSDYLTHRRSKWPHTANPNLLISQQTAKDTRPVTAYYIGQLFKGHTVTLDGMRSDRWLEEALSHGPDPCTSRPYSASAPPPPCATPRPPSQSWKPSLLRAGLCNQLLMFPLSISASRAAADLASGAPMRR